MKSGNLAPVMINTCIESGDLTEVMINTAIKSSVLIPVTIFFGVKSTGLMRVTIYIGAKSSDPGSMIIYKDINSCRPGCRIIGPLFRQLPVVTEIIVDDARKVEQSYERNDLTISFSVEALKMPAINFRDSGAKRPRMVYNYAGCCLASLPYPPAPACHEPTQQQLQQPEYKEPVVPGIPTAGDLPHIMQLQDMVINDAFHQVENAPAQQYTSPEQALRAVDVLTLKHFPEQPDADGRREEGEQMKNAIPKHIHTFGQYGIGRYPVGEHLVPLEDLVQHDTIRKAAKPHAEHDGCRGERDIAPCCRMASGGMYASTASCSPAAEHNNENAQNDEGRQHCQQVGQYGAVVDMLLQLPVAGEAQQCWCRGIWHEEDCFGITGKNCSVQCGAAPYRKSRIAAALAEEEKVSVWGGLFSARYPVFRSFRLRS